MILFLKKMSTAGVKNAHFFLLNNWKHINETFLRGRIMKPKDHITFAEIITQVGADNAKRLMAKARLYNNLGKDQSPENKHK